MTSFNYFISIVPTIFFDNNLGFFDISFYLPFLRKTSFFSKLIHTNQYAVTEYKKENENAGIFLR